MESKRIAVKPSISMNPARSSMLINQIKNLFNGDQFGLMALNLQGKVLYVNDLASVLIGKSSKQLENHYLWTTSKRLSMEHKRQFIRARKFFKLAKDGVAQQFSWLETHYKKPVLALNILMYRTELQKKPIIIAKFNNILQTKTIEWVLWSLANLSKHGEIITIINEIIKLTNKVFSSDYAMACLIDSQKNARSISFYHRSRKKKEIEFSLTHSPLEQILIKKSICNLKNIEKHFQKKHLIKKMNANFCLIGPIINSQNQVIGLISVLSKKDIKSSKLNNTLFRLFLERVNWEIEKLLSQQQLQFFASIVEHSPNPVLTLLTSGEVIFANNKGKEVLTNWMKKYTILPDCIIQAAYQVQETKEVITTEVDAGNKSYLFTISWNDNFKQIVIYGANISQIKTAEQDIVNMARYDALTQVANRQYFEKKLSETLEEHAYKPNKLGILLIDLDDFKTINDTLGHPIGDQLLKAVTKRMMRCLREDDFLARLGGDEFIIILNNTTSHSAKLIAEKILNVLARPYQFGDYQLKITASIGIGIYPEAGTTINELLKNTDIAMYQAKNEGKNSYMQFSMALNNISYNKDEDMRGELHHAISKNEFFIVYQPQFDIKTNKTIGVEAFLHWLHPKHGSILPVEFFPLAEQTGYIQEINQWLIHNTLKDFTLFLKCNPELKLSINVTIYQLNDSQFLKILLTQLAKFKLKEEQIIIDISETYLSTFFKKIAKNIKKFNKSGIKTCIDNFGSPLVSIPKLLALPIDYLKLDPQLLIGIEKKLKQRMLLRGIIKLAKELKIIVIQKGVETQEQHKIIKSIGYRNAQGYFYCKPLAANQIKGYLCNYSVHNTSS